MSYDVSNRFKELVSILDEYSEWFMEVTRHIFYPAQYESQDEFVKPNTFLNWLARHRQDQGLDETLCQTLEKLHNDLTEKAVEALQAAQTSKNPPEYKAYNNLATLFGEFIYQSRRLERDCLLEDNGIDSLTGLRSINSLKTDFKREIDRLERSGKPFSLAIVEIDELDEVKEHHENPNYADELITTVAELIKKSLRSYDDGYRLDEGLFILSLKQVHSEDGIRALKRLQHQLEDKGAFYLLNDEKRYLSLSSCITEVVESDNLDELLENLKADLKMSAKDKGMIFQYHEMSPIQRFVKMNEEAEKEAKS